MDGELRVETAATGVDGHIAVRASGPRQPQVLAHRGAVLVGGGRVARGVEGKGAVARDGRGTVTFVVRRATAGAVAGQIAGDAHVETAEGDASEPETARSVLDEQVLVASTGSVSARVLPDRSVANRAGGVARDEGAGARASGIGERVGETEAVQGRVPTVGAVRITEDAELTAREVDRDDVAGKT